MACVRARKMMMMIMMHVLKLRKSFDVNEINGGLMSSPNVVIKKLENRNSTFPIKISTSHLTGPDNSQTV